MAHCQKEVGHVWLLYISAISDIRWERWEICLYMSIYSKQKLCFKIILNSLTVMSTDGQYLLSMMKRLTKMATKAPVVNDAALVTGIFLGILHKVPVHNWPHTHLKLPSLLTQVEPPKQGESWHSSMSTHLVFSIS